MTDRYEPGRHPPRSHRIRWGQEEQGPTSHHANKFGGPQRRWIARWSRFEGRSARQNQLF